MAPADPMELGRSFSSCESVASRYIHPIESNGPVTRGTKRESTTMSSNYSEYSVTVGTDPGYYGSQCSEEDGRRIAESIADLIRREFVGIQINMSDTGRPVTGPDSQVVEEIREWVESNWTAAL